MRAHYRRRPSKTNGGHIRRVFGHVKQPVGPQADMLTGECNGIPASNLIAERQTFAEKHLWLGLLRRRR